MMMKTTVKKLTATTLVGLALAGAFVATGAQDVKANTPSVSIQGISNNADLLKTTEQVKTLAAKAELKATLDKVGFQYLEHDFNLADYYGGHVIGVFESNYRDMYLGSKPKNPMSEADFYTKVRENIISKNVKKIHTKLLTDASGEPVEDAKGHLQFVEEGRADVFEGIFYNNGQFIRF